MALTDLSTGDFEYFRSYAKDMIKCHEQEFVKYIDPDMMSAMYRGRKGKKKDWEASQSPSDDSKHVLALSRLFAATNTILPNLYYQNPAPLVTPLRNSDDDSAALMTAILKHYQKLNQSKRQNQEAVLNAWFFGIGWKKMGYRTVFQSRTPEPENQPEPGMMDKIMKFGQNMMGMGGAPTGTPDNTESKPTPELADYETLFNDSESPMNVMLDHKADLANGRARLFRLPRTLNDLENFGNYENIDDLIKYFKAKQGSGTRFDSRNVDLTLMELHVKQRNGIWICTWVEEFAKPLRYDKSSSLDKDFLSSPLVFTNEPGVRYPTSHMKVASQVQCKLDDLASMYVETVARSRRMLAINTKALGTGQEAALETNLIQGILKFTKDISPAVMQNIASSPVSNDLPTLMSLLQGNVTEILGVDQQAVAGKSTNDTLGQDELARVGTQIRESGMMDKVHDWMCDQYRKEGNLVKQFSTAELHVVITGKDYSNPQTGEKVEDKWISFMVPENPLGAKHYLQGEFEYDMNVYDAVKPDKKSQQASYEKLLMATSNPNLNQMALQGSYQIRTDKILKKWLESFEGISNPDQFIEELDPMQKAAIQAQQVLMQSGGSMMQGAQAGRQAQAQTQQQGEQKMAQQDMSGRQQAEQQRAKAQNDSLQVTAPSSKAARG